MASLLLRLPVDLLVHHILSKIQDASSLARFGQVSWQCHNLGRTEELWKQRFSSTRYRFWQRCGAAVMRATSNETTVFALLATSHRHCEACTEAGRHRISFPVGKYSKLISERESCEATWLLGAQTLRVAAHGPRVLCALWLTRHGARWWVRTAPSDAFDTGIRGDEPGTFIMEEARACVSGVHDVPGWSMLPPLDTACNASTRCSLDLSPPEWRRLEGWLISADGAAGEHVLQMVPPQVGSYSARLMANVRASLLAHSCVLTSGNVLLLFQIRAGGRCCHDGQPSQCEYADGMFTRVSPVTAVHIASGRHRVLDCAASYDETIR